jgi:hypothetical protein
VIQEAKQTFGVGKWWTAEGKRAIVDACVDDLLIGRVDIAFNPDLSPIWYAAIWTLDGHYRHGNEVHNLQVNPVVKVQRTFWLNVYQDGPGLLRNTWEESLIEASREEKQPLCRVEVKVDSFVGDGLK